VESLLMENVIAALRLENALLLEAHWRVVQMEVKKVARAMILLMLFLTPRHAEVFIVAVVVPMIRLK
jgi:hypothetical protein